MATCVIPEHAQLSPEAEYRNTIYADSYERLQHFVHRAFNIFEMSNNEVVAVCIQVDSRWKYIVDQLMPSHDWQEYRDRGEEPIARGTATWSLCEVVAEQFPDITDVLLEKPTEGMAKVIVLSDGGCTVYEIEAKAAAAA